MTMGHPRPWPGYPHHTGLISAAMTDVIATCSSHPRFRHQLSSDSVSRRTPLLRRMVPVITVHKGLPPLNAHHYSTHQARTPVLLCDPPCATKRKTYPRGSVSRSSRAFSSATVSLRKV